MSLYRNSNEEAIRKTIRWLEWANEGLRTAKRWKKSSLDRTNAEKLATSK
jgi:hypothetical protein